MSTPRPISTGWISRNSIAALLTGLLLSTATLPAVAEEPAAEGTAAENTAPGTTAATVETATPANNDGNTVSDTGRVARAMFTSAIVDREPVDSLDTIPNSVHQVFFFSDLRGLTGQIVTHRWQYQGKVMAEVKFKVGNGARWRVYSSKNLLPEWTGSWTVTVTDESGRDLQTTAFEYTAAAEATEATATTQTP